MPSHRFEVTPVPEPAGTDLSSPERIPLIRIENEVPQPPPMPATLSATSDTTTNNRLASILFSSILKRRAVDTRRRATVAAAIASLGKQGKRSASAERIDHPHSTSTSAIVTSHTASSLTGNNEETDAYSSIQSNNYDSNPLAITNKFLQELRSKRRELREKSKNISIDLRIDLNRRQNRRPILRAQDIFNVHFQSHDDDDDHLLLSQANIFTEEAQEKMRNDIYKELNRQQAKRFRKQNRKLIVGRLLLMLMTSLFVMMSLILVYAVTDLYERADYFAAKLSELEFIPMSFDKTAKFY